MRVLVATDGSNDAKAAVEWLRHLPLPAEREVLVVTVVDPPMVAAGADVAGEFRSALIADARRLADDTASDLLAIFRTAIGRVVEGDPREEIVAAAESWGADLVVVGARGLGAIKEFFLGSVSLWVVRHASCPVLVCKGAPRDIHAITVALDGSEHATQALAWVTALPLTAGGRLRFLAVAEPQHYPSTAPGIIRTTLRTAVAAIEAERRTALETTLTSAARALRARVPAIETAAVTGVPADVIVRDIERCGTDLVVLGARGAGAITRLLLGSVSEAVVRHAGCPVLIVRRRV
jgi:nucleotide-binding universal stress UspA family protein